VHETLARGFQRKQRHRVNRCPSAFRFPVVASHGSGISRIPNRLGPVISTNLFSRKSSSPDFFTCSTTGQSHSHGSCRLRALSRKTIDPGWTGTSRNSTKFRALVATTASHGRAHSAKHYFLAVGLRPGRLNRAVQRGVCNTLTKPASARPNRSWVTEGGSGIDRSVRFVFRSRWSRAECGN
jgi:hypothetical protein